MLDESAKGLLLNVTGNGKGKSTSAFGTAIRALGWGWNVLLLQFVKGTMETGEKRFFDSLQAPNLEFAQLGAGASWEPGDHAALARQNSISRSITIGFLSTRCWARSARGATI